MKRFGAVAIALAGVSAAAPSWPADCASDVAGLRRLAGDPGFPLRWIEIGMDDGRPLVLELGERDGALHMRFDKAAAGLWAQGAGSICAAGQHLEMRFAPGQMRPGPHANWLLRQALRAGGRFTFARSAAGELHVATAGWSGRFTHALANE